MNSPNALPWLLLGVLVYVAFKWELVGGLLVAGMGVFTVFFQCIQISIRFLFDFSSIIQKVHYGKMGNSQYDRCVQYLSSRNMKTKNVSRDTIKKIRLDRISPNPNQARIDFDKAGLVELAESIEATGLLQPIIVKPIDNRFQIIAGERRWSARIRRFTKTLACP